MFNTLIRSLSQTLPYVLALLLFGQLLGLAASYYTGYGRLLFIVGIGVLLALAARASSNKIAPSWLDGLMASFFTIVLVSLFVNGKYQEPPFLRQCLQFMILPYVAGRLLNQADIEKFLRAVGVVGLATIILISIALMQLPASQYHVDKIQTLFSPTTQLFGGVPFNTFAGFTLGALLPLLFLYKRGMKPKLRIWMVLWCLWLMLLVSTRAHLLASIATCAAGIMMLQEHRLRNLVYLGMAVFLTLAILPKERSYFLLGTASQLASVAQRLEGKAAPETSKAATALVAKPAPVTSIEVRYTLLLEAVSNFRAHPWFGNGAANSPTDAASSPIFPHNLILYLWSDLGIIGSLPLILVILHLLRDYGSKLHRESIHPVNMVALLWFYALLTEQFSGNYFIIYQVYALTGILIAVASKQLNSKII